MIEYAVLHFYSDGRVAVCYWGATAEDVLAEAARCKRALQVEAEQTGSAILPGVDYRAVQTSRFGHFESLTGDSLY